MFIATADLVRINMDFVKYFEPSEADDPETVECLFRFIDGLEMCGLISLADLARIDAHPAPPAR